MNTFQIACTAAIAFCFIIIRARWIAWKIEEYRVNILWFCVATKQDKEIIQDMSRLWPMTIMIFQIWNWSFRKYVVDLEKYDEMMEFISNNSDKIFLDPEN